MFRGNVSSFFIEFMTLDIVKVKLLNWQPLK